MNEAVRVTTVGVIGFVSSVSLSTLNLYVSLLVGIITLLYMSYKLIREIYLDIQSWKAKRKSAKEVKLIISSEIPAQINKSYFDEPRSNK